MPGGVNPTNGTKGPSRPEAPLGYGYVPGTSSNAHGNANYQILAKYPPGPVPVFVPAQPSAQLVGVKNAYLVHTESVNTNPLTPGPAFTTTTFDTTSRADSAKILLNNGATAQMAITSCGIFGQKVHQLSGTSGFIHDKYVNYESIAIDGDRLLQIGNNMICTLAQVNQIADIQWKRNKVKRHIYTVTIPGTLTYFEPGEWYTLVVGSAGTQENINSLVECYSVKISHGVSDIGNTQIDFREVLQNWKFDSNETARFISAGGFNRKPTNKVLTVAASTYVGQADFYCDGTADEVEMNNAINILQSQGGGTVKLTEGKFTKSNALDYQGSSNISVDGSGIATQIVESGTNNSVNCVGLVGTHSSGCSLSNLRFSSPNSLNIQYSDSFKMTNILWEGTIASTSVVTGAFIIFQNCVSVLVTSCEYNGQQLLTTGVHQIIYFTNCDNTIFSNNIIRGFRSDNIAVGIAMGAGAPSQVIANRIYDIASSANFLTAGIYLSGDRCIVSNNRVELIENSFSSTKVNGIRVGGGIGHIVSGNYCFNNGSDTGIANTNGNNFYDGGTDTQYSG